MYLLQISISLLLLISTAATALPLSTPLIPLLDTLINITITASTLNSAPPTALTTTTHSLECADVNQGALVCCPSIVDGDQPVVVMAAKMFGFVLNGNSVNGVGCRTIYNGAYCPVLEHRLCCQVTDLMVLPLVSLAMWCHRAEEL
ncbi:Bhl1 [Botrytis cinerea B05.10]|uniref:Hydrophobin-like protein 1 n=2 Tax=Botryotinia fuckeliana TaxID=40559 RepID=BHL1_BOTFB|nr:Bhl1 [Botrytis cinerea B05.10]XP_024549081.1 Bhl1 [Botrytis cinerea B05.10]ATZ50547.1 Bhl1 [Botrytis cinerea B05.10]ATZ50548.1 Bhl1 [Botrytis cinerea B05.10]CCD49294.1 Bhl1, hydrophobin-like [Botrytis cinerea T4]